MKTSKFKRVEQPKRVEPEWKMCKACNVFRAECYVPVGERSEQMCWLCAHIHVEHDVPIDKILNSEACECAPHEIDPTRPHPSVLNGTYVERPQYVGRDSMRRDSAPLVAPVREECARREQAAFEQTETDCVDRVVLIRN